VKDVVGWVGGERWVKILKGIIYKINFNFFKSL